MATDWTPRAEALAYYEKHLKRAMRGDEDFEHLEQAVNALRRSQDHTAIQDRIKATLAQRDELLEALQYADEQAPPNDPEQDDSDIVTVEVTAGWVRELREVIAKATTSTERSGS